MQVVVASFCVFAFVVSVLSLSAGVLGRDGAATRDYVEYWASAQQLRHGLNPYDRNQIPALEASVGFGGRKVLLVTPNPPWALSMILPLGFVNAKAGELLWIAVLIGAFVGSITLLETVNCTSKDLRLFTYTFAPALVCIGAGQMSILVLLGVALFLRFYETKPALAGIGLAVCMLKPHLLLGFGVAVLLWSLQSNRWKLLGSTLIVLFGSVAGVMALDKHVWPQYAAMMREARIDRLDIPCLSVEFRNQFGSGSVWAGYLPAFIAVTWAVAYFWRRRAEWDWSERAPVLIVVSVLAAPYMWICDQCVLLAAMIAVLSRMQSRALLWALAAISAVIELSPLAGFPLFLSRFYLWTVPAWCVWYWLADRIGTRQTAANPILQLHSTEAPSRL